MLGDTVLNIAIQHASMHCKTVKYIRIQVFTVLYNNLQHHAIRYKTEINDIMLRLTTVNDQLNSQDPNKHSTWINAHPLRRGF